MSRTSRPSRQALSIVGVTRFSVDPASIIKADSECEELATARTAVFDKARLGHRFRLFKEFAFPSMAAAARQYPDFHYVVLISPRLPAYYKVRLYYMQLSKSWFHVRMIGKNDRFSDITRQAISRLSNGNRVFNFRIDDDDAMRPSFIDKIVELSGTCDNGIVISFDLGYYLQRLEPFEFRMHKKRYPKIAIGLGVFSDPEAPTCIYEQGVHQKLPAKMVVNIRDDYYWIRTLHAQNDSGMRANESARMLGGEVCDRLRPAFGHLSLERALLALPATESVGTDRTALRALFGIQ